MAMIDREGDERPRLKARCFKTEMTKCNGGASIKAAESPNGGDSALQKAKAKAADSRRTRFCAAMRILVPSGKADVFGFGLLVDGNVRVGVLPEGEEVLIRFASVGAGRISIRALRGLRFEGVGAAQA